MKVPATTEFRVGIGSVPYLADHGFQDMVVLPGSWYLDLALRLEREASGRVPRLVRNVTFHNPVILSAADTVIKVGVKDRDDRRAEYAFYEGGAALQPAASLEIDRDGAASAEAGGLSIEAFQARAQAVISGEQFYRTLRESGNQYGPRFQNVSAIWRAGDQSLCKLAVASEHKGGGPHCLHPSLLDSMTQLLAPFLTEKGKTFVLRSIERVALWDTGFPDALWGHATLRTAPEGGDAAGIGDIRVFDASGRPYLELSGVAFTLLDRADAGDENAATTLLIAANFTAQPLEDSLNFWGDHFGVAVRPEFAPYDQVFQQLLDTGSALRRNRDGVNVVLLRLEEWAAAERPCAMTLSREQADRCFGNQPRRTLPNGLEIAHLNRYETDYLYREIFEEQCYLKHGIRLDDGATVLDIGANIGLFSLFVMSRCANATVYACEPAPVAYELLKTNCDAYGSNVRALNVGVSDRPKTATFTFYEKSSVFSGFYSDEAEDRRAIQTVVRSMLESEAAAGESVEEYVEELTADRLEGRRHECRTTSVSDIIREHRIDRIDLLKIDAEKSELDILAGIEDRDWPKIDQIVLEIHDRTHAAAERIENLLVEKGYRCAVERQTLLERAGLVNLYATRRAAGEGVVANATQREREKAGNLEGKVRDFCAALRSSMDQGAVPLVLCLCPAAPGAQASTPLAAALRDAEQTLLAEAAAIPNVHAIGSASLLQRYPVADYYEPHGLELGHVPYTPAGYAAIGTAVFRAIYSLRAGPFKVIVLDCDNTLWKGVCAEEGAKGIEVTAGHRALQEFMIGQMNAGMLLCLCSKNDESDVLDVLDQRHDMPLKREHLVAWRINWNRKSENVRSLAAELGLGLDSFIFLDDNPVDCADVRINCPEVATLELPGDAGSFPAFLSHAWVFDRAGSTAEDRSRTRMYQEGARRQRHREQSLSLQDFIRGLELEVEIAAATEDELARVSQLTLRTNQFNLTSIRRTESEIRALLKRGGASCLTVRVADRFGDYGLVGVVIYEPAADRYTVDTLLLSCRVLGRGVEHALLSRLGQRALADGKEFVDVRCVATGKNRLALEFMARVGDGYRHGDGAWTFPAQHLARLRYDAEETARSAGEAPADAEPAAPRAAALRGAGRSEPLQRIAAELRDVERLAKAVEEHRLSDQVPVGAAERAPGNALETALADIWRKVLRQPRIGLNDNFFEAGGTSLKAVQVIAAIKRELRETLSIVSLFECPTVALLAAKIGAASAEAGGASTASAAALRGQRRRHHTARQRVSVP